MYTPGPGYVLPVGTHSLWVTFTPSDSNGYAPQQASVTIVVAKGTPAISWPSPAKIIYGTPLGEAHLNASAPVPGKFEYSPAAGEMLPPGMHTLSVTFTPADTANYSTAKATVSLSVAKAKSAIHWPAPAPVMYGTQLSGAHLCARASVPGSFEYKPDLGAVLAAGEHQLTVVFTPADTLGYSISQTAVSLKVTKATPAIRWPVPDPIAQDVALGAAQLNAVAPVQGTFAYTPAASEKLAPGVHELTAIFTPADTLELHAGERDRFARGYREATGPHHMAGTLRNFLRHRAQRRSVERHSIGPRNIFLHPFRGSRSGPGEVHSLRILRSIGGRQIHEGASNGRARGGRISLHLFIAELNR